MGSRFQPRLTGGRIIHRSFVVRSYWRVPGRGGTFKIKGKRLIVEAVMESMGSMGSVGGHGKNAIRRDACGLKGG